MDNCIALDWDVERCRAEIMEHMHLPRYDLDTDFYNQFCVVQNTGFVVACSWTAEQTRQLPYIGGLLHQYGLLDQVGHSQMFVCRPRHMGMWHLDGVDRHASINFPLWNTSRGRVDWTEHEVEHIREANQYTTHAVQSRWTDYYPVSHSSVLHGVQLLKTDKWHRLDNTDNDHHRVVFSIRFATNPTYEWLRTRLQRQL
jgi:hypothetical protein